MKVERLEFELVPSGDTNTSGGGVKALELLVE